MSSCDRARLWPRLVASGLVIGLGGCFRPLYGPTASGVPLRDALASISVEMPASPIGQERLGHYVQSELVYALDGSGTPHEKLYKLKIETAENVQPTSVDTVSGRADAAILNGTIKYTLTTNDGKTILTTGTSRATATYNRDQQRFASVRAARDADIRVGQQISEDIKQRLAAYFATTP